ncbi:hypothetical protein ILYODFUR_034466 [Ilyodon furcidens]|uniref:Secreted protein n=1 Tax=Ilyodon furcidens TaxID=33524 RepID=A0ABV0VL01_9TELE
MQTLHVWTFWNFFHGLFLQLQHHQLPPASNQTHSDFRDCSCDGVLRNDAQTTGNSVSVTQEGAGLRSP